MTEHSHQRDRETDRQTDRQTDRDRDRETERQRQRQRQRDRQRQTETERGKKKKKKKKKRNKKKNKKKKNKKTKWSDKQFSTMRNAFVKLLLRRLLTAPENFQLGNPTRRIEAYTKSICLLRTSVSQPFLCLDPINKYVFMSTCVFASASFQ